ncbi:MAG: hypothetical protein AAF466_14910 [Bacteroidota bacterium]
MLSRGIVKGSTQLSKYFGRLVPQSVKDKVAYNFTKPELILTKDQSINAPAFDMIRASVNLMVAGVLISIATSMKLPLSTTYVTFMVAMGTSLADKAWGRESAVYRVAGVLNVIGGWFFTAFGALIAAGTVTFLITLNKEVVLPILLIITVALLVRNYISHKKKSVQQVDPDALKKSASKTVQGIIEESADNIGNVVSRTNKIYSAVLKGLAKENTKALQKSRNGVEKLDTEIEELRDHLFYFIKNLDETSVRGSSFYITILAYLTDVAQSLDYISKKSFKHVNNNHKALRFNQIKDLQEIDTKFEKLLKDIRAIFDNREFEKLGDVLVRKQGAYDDISAMIEKQIQRTRTEESSPKNTTLYFNLLMETKDLVTALMNLIEEYYNSYNKEV